MKKLLILLMFLLLFFSSVFASYKSDLAKAYAYYKAGDYENSLIYYKRAYKQHPTKQVYNYIVYLENKLRGRGRSPKESSYYGGIYWAPQRHIITANPVGLIFGYLNAHYEMAIERTNGLGFDAGLVFPPGGWGGFGMSLGAEYNWYFQNHALNGWYAGPLAGIEFEELNYSYNVYGFSGSGSGTVFGLEIGGHGGYRWIWDSGFTVDVNGGFGYIIANSVSINETINGVKVGTVTASVGGFGLLLGCNLGYAF